MAPSAPRSSQAYSTAPRPPAARLRDADTGRPWENSVRTAHHRPTHAADVHALLFNMRHIHLHRLDHPARLGRVQASPRRKISIQGRNSNCRRRHRRPLDNDRSAAETTHDSTAAKIITTRRLPSIKLH